MLTFAGVFTLGEPPADPPPLDQVSRILEAQNPAPLRRIERGRLAVVWHEDTTLPDPGLFESPTRLVLLNGDPLYSPAPKPRDEQAALLAQAPDPAAALSLCPGSFALLHHDLDSGQLLLATDALGARTIHYTIRNGRLFFASQLSILEQWSALPLTASTAALLEFLQLGYNLDGRSPYCEVRCLRQGEYLTAGPDGCSTRFYHRWDQLEPVELDYPGRARRAYELFRQAVERRSWRSPDAAVMISGGLDSRMCATVLHQTGKRIVAINCAPGAVRLQDESIAVRLTRALGCELVRVPIPPGSVSWSRLAQQGLDQLNGRLDPVAARAIFSGDGGSVGLGFVYYQPDTIALLREGRLDEVVRRYVSPFLRIPGRYVAQDAGERAHQVLRRSIESLTRAIDAEPGRQFHLFLMNNDQRCHMHGYFDALASLRHEVHIPFYDADLLRFLLACPADDFTGHRIYHDILAHLPAAVNAVPWQTYPGHLPCPVADPDDGSCSQFSPQAREKLKRVLNSDVPHALGPALRPLFPGPPFRRLPVLLTSLLAAATGSGRFAYVHRAVRTASRISAAAEGRVLWDLPGE